MSDISRGPGWWIASDGKWYPPESHPDAVAARSKGPMVGVGAGNAPGAAGAGSGPGATLVTPHGMRRPQVDPSTIPQGVRGPQQAAASKVDPGALPAGAEAGQTGSGSAVFAGGPGAASTFSVGSGKEHRRSRRLPLLLVVVVVVAAVCFVFARPIGKLVGTLVHGSTTATTIAPSSSTGTFSLPNVNVRTLAGERIDPGAIQADSVWHRLLVRVKATSTPTSFGGIFGPDPLRRIPTTRTFMAIAAEPLDATASSRGLTVRMTSQMQLVKGKIRGAHVAVAPPAPSVFGGSIVCGTAASARTVVGECVWQSPTVAVLVVTFSSDIGAVRRLTERVVLSLHRQAEMARVTRHRTAAG